MRNQPRSPTPGRPPSSSPFVGYGCYIVTLPVFGLAVLCFILGQAASSQGNWAGPLYLIVACVVFVIGVVCLIAALAVNEKEADKKTAEELSALQERGRKIQANRRRIARLTSKKHHRADTMQ